MFNVLGAGGIGCLAATRIPGAVLVLRNSHRLYQYQQVDETITMAGDQNFAVPVPGTTPDLLENGSISHLIVATKCPDTVAAVKPVLGKLAANPTIVLLQNGIGTDSELRTLLNDSGLEFVYAVTSQGVKRTSAAFRFEQSGTGPFLYSRRPRGAAAAAGAAATPDPSIPGFKWVDWPEFETARLEKLLVNAAINPLTALLRCKNGALVQEKFQYLVHPVVRESCTIVNAAFGQQFVPETVAAKVLEVARLTAGNTSSMLADVLAGHGTEIDYINGALVDLGKRAGVRTAQNAMLRDLVKLTAGSEEVPFVWRDLHEWVDRDASA